MSLEKGNERKENLDNNAENVAETAEKITTDATDTASSIESLDTSDIDNDVLNAFNEMRTATKQAMSKEVENEVSTPTKEIVDEGGQIIDYAKEGEEKNKGNAEILKDVQSRSEIASSTVGGGIEASEESAEAHKALQEETAETVNKAKETDQNTHNEVDDLL